MKKYYYFSHDMNARNDEKILKLRTEYGWEGYGIYFALLEMLFEAEDNKLSLSNLKFISYNLNIRLTTLKKVLSLCFTVRLFEKDENYFWSNGMKKRREELNKKIKQTRQAAAISVQKRKEKQERLLQERSNENLTNVQKNVNEKDTNKIKENKIKIKENNNNCCSNSNSVSDSCVDGLQEIISFYNDNIGAISPYSLSILEDYAKEMPKDLIILAMKKAVESNARNIKYIKGVLNNWVNSGIKTVLEAEEENRKFKKSKTVEYEETEEEKTKRKIKELEELMNANK